MCELIKSVWKWTHKTEPLQKEEKEINEKSREVIDNNPSANRQFNAFVFGLNLIFSFRFRFFSRLTRKCKCNLQVSFSFFFFFINFFRHRQSMSRIMCLTLRIAFLLSLISDFASSVKDSKFYAFQLSFTIFFPTISLFQLLTTARYFRRKPNQRE